MHEAHFYNVSVLNGATPSELEAEINANCCGHVRNVIKVHGQEYQAAAEVGPDSRVVRIPWEHGSSSRSASTCIFS